MENIQNHGDVNRSVKEKTKIRTNQNDINRGHSSHIGHKCYRTNKTIHNKTILRKLYQEHQRLREL